MSKLRDIIKESIREVVSEQTTPYKKVTRDELMRGIDVWCKDNGFDGKGSRTYKTNTVPVYEDVDGVVIEGLMGLIENYCYVKDMKVVSEEKHRESNTSSSQADGEHEHIKPKFLKNHFPGDTWDDVKGRWNEMVVYKDSSGHNHYFREFMRKNDGKRKIGWAYNDGKLKGKYVPTHIKNKLDKMDSAMRANDGGGSEGWS